MGNEETKEVIAPLESDRSIWWGSGVSGGGRETEMLQVKTITVRSVEEVQILKRNFDFRLKHREYLAHLYGFEMGGNQPQNTTLQNLPCNFLLTETKITLHYQKVTLKFSDLYNVSIQSGANLLIHCLNGFSILLDKFGYFTPESRLIFKQGESWVVWVSDNIFSIKNQVQDKSQCNNIKVRCKFWKNIVHIFDMLRDELNPHFSYSSYIYGDCQSNNSLKEIQLKQILQKLHEINSIKLLKRSSQSVLQKSIIESNSTIGRVFCNTKQSFDENTNDATFEKKTNQFSGNNTPNTPKINKYPVNVVRNQQKDIVDDGLCIIENQYEEIHDVQRNNGQQKKIFPFFKRISSKELKQINPNEILQTREFDYQKHARGTSSISTLTNFTGRAKQMASLRKFVNPIQFEGCFLKKQQEKNVDFIVTATPYPQNRLLQPRKITQNSEGNEESSQPDYIKNDRHEISMISSQHEQHEVLYCRSPSQCTQQEKSIRNPSIINNTPDMQEYLSFNLKGSHRRSFTDQIEIEQPKTKMKLCLSQQFDSDFFSSCSRKDTPLSSQNSINNFGTLKECKKILNSELNISIENQQVRNSQNHFRKVRISNQKSNAKAVKDSIMEHSGVQDISSGNKETSIARLGNFKSEGRLKSLLGKKMHTLKSIKQIDVDAPIDEQILKDLNKMFPKLHFAKSTKMTE